MVYDILKTLPFWILGLGGVLVFILESFLKKGWPRSTVTAVISLLAGLSAIYFRAFYVDGSTAFNGQIYVDSLTLFTTLLITLATTLVVFLSSNRLDIEQIESKGEYYGLMLIATAGAILFCNARDFICLFLGLEILSMAIYCLCGSCLERRESSESAMKYFLLGSFSSAFFLYGLTLLYGLTGSLIIPEVAGAITGVDQNLMLLAMGFVIFGFAFKVGLAPVHFWVPDVYQGAPTSVTAFMATVVKVSAVTAFLRVLWGIFGVQIEDWSKLIWVLALVTIVAGNLLALRQRNVKRMLAYSSIAHAGYMLCAFLFPSNSFSGGSAVLFYLVSYVLVSIGAFGVLMSLNSDHGTKYDVSSFYGLSSKKPFLAFSFTFFLLALAGLPPGMAGFVGKFYVFGSAVSAGYIGLSIIAMLASTVSCYYYLRVIVAMYFMNSSNSEESITTLSSIQVGVLTCCLILSVGLGVFPQVIYDFTSSVSSSLSK